MVRALSYAAICALTLNPVLSPVIASDYRASAAATASAGGQLNARFLPLGIGKSVVIDLPRDVKDVLVADPKIANAVVRSAQRAYIIGAAVGQTNIIFFDSTGQQIAAYDIAVTRDLNGVRAALKHGPATSGTEFAEDIEDKNLDERDYVNSNYVWFVVHDQIIKDTNAEDIDMEQIIYHQGIEDTEQKRYYESSRFSEGMERQVIIKMERMWEYYDPKIYKKLDNLTSEDRLIAILQEIKEYDAKICKSILERLSSFDGNIQLTQVARPFRETIGSLIGQHSPARIKDNFDQKSDLWVSNFSGGRIEYKSDDQDGVPIKRTSTSSEIKWGDIDNI